MNNTVIKLENISKEYKRGSETVHAVKDVNLEIKKGEYVAITGRSGSGKTTLLNMIGCLDRPSNGKIEVNGFHVTGEKEKDLTKIRKKTIGFIFQQFFLIPTLTVLQNVKLPALFAGKIIDGRAEELLEMVGLSQRLNHLPGQLSGGEMQRVAIARSLINDPPVLLADEPTGNLDTSNAEAVMDIFDQLNQKGISIIVVTHDKSLAKHAKRAIVIKDGEIEHDSAN